MPPDKTASSRRWLLTMLYWFGVLLVLIGVVFRFYFGQLQLGISLAVVGVGLLLLARLNSKLMR